MKIYVTLYVLLMYDSHWWCQQISCWGDEEGYSPRKIMIIKKLRQAKGELYFELRHGGPEAPPLLQPCSAGSSQTLGHFRGDGARAGLWPYQPAGARQRQRFIKLPSGKGRRHTAVPVTQFFS